MARCVAAQSEIRNPQSAIGFDDAFESVLQDLIGLRMRAAAEGRVEYAALDSAARQLARLWSLKHSTALVESSAGHGTLEPGDET